MKVHRAHFTETRRLLEELFTAKHPTLLQKLRESLQRVDAALAEIGANLQLLDALAARHPRAAELIGRCASYISATLGGERGLLERRQIAERLEAVSQALHAFTVTLHSLEHLEEAAGGEWTRRCAAMRAAAARVHEEHARVARQMSKHCQVFTYFEGLFAGFEARVAALRAEWGLLESQPDNYTGVIATLAARFPAAQKPGGLRACADWFRQRELVAAQLELLLEQPAISAFEFFRSEAEPAAGLPAAFGQIVSCLNGPEFVQSHLLRFSLADLLHTFRHLFAAASAAELQRELCPFPYHEESFIELCCAYARLCKAIAASDYREPAALLRDIKDYGGESRASRDFSDKLFEATLRGARHEKLLGEFDRFREHVQTFCMNEFGAVVIVYA